MLIHIEEIMALENHYLWNTIMITITKDTKTSKWKFDEK